MNDNEKKILTDAIQVLGDLIAAAATGGAALPVLVKDGPAAKDALERIILEAPALDAPNLDPVDRANADAASAADETAKFGPPPVVVDTAPAEVKAEPVK